jgi:hypothetical protein
MEEWILARAAVSMSVAVSWRVVPAWLMKMYTGSTYPQYRRKAQRRRWYECLGLIGEFLMASEVLAKVDLKENEIPVLAVEGVGVWGGVGWHSSGVDDARGGARSCRYLRRQRKPLFVLMYNMMCILSPTQGLVGFL